MAVYTRWQETAMKIMKELDFILRSEASLINPWTEIGFERGPTIVIITSDNNPNNEPMFKMGASIFKISLPTRLLQNDSSATAFIKEKLKEALIEKIVQIVEKKPKEALPSSIKKSVRAMGSYRNISPKKDPVLMVPVAKKPVPVAKKSKLRKTKRRKNPFRPSKEVLEARMIYYNGDLQKLLKDPSIWAEDIDMLKIWIKEDGLEYLTNPRQHIAVFYLKQNRLLGGFYCLFHLFNYFFKYLRMILSNF